MHDSFETVEECLGEVMSNLEKIAQTYVGTPHINGGNVKGAGLDCCTLVTSLYREAGIIDVTMPTGYANDWYCRKNHEEYILAYLEKYCERVHELREGDLISYRWGRSDYAHIAVYFGRGRIIHSEADSGTSITDLTDPKLYDHTGKSRVTGYWRLKDGIIPRK